ncbi:MAG: bifunctional hydroxymethylpyrimidine kinase/phosphomethylpyrimidine kinase [Acidimicrobiales bacterium]
MTGSAPVVVLTIAGSDSSAGAGLQADLKTFGAFGVFGVCAVTAVTAQNTTGVLGVVTLEASFVALQLAALDADLPIAVAKTGMLGSSDIVCEVARWAARAGAPPVVVDPVLMSSSGTSLLEPGALDAYRCELIPVAAVLTPNMREAAALTGRPVESVDDMRRAAAELAALGPDVVVVKGGHGGGASAPDVVLAGGHLSVLEAPRVTTVNDHGTGCTLAAAIAAGLAAGVAPLRAVEDAKQFVHRALQGAASWRLGAGRGPLDHFGFGASPALKGAS